MSGGDGYLNLKTYRTISRTLTNAGLDHRVETMTKHYKIVVDTPMGERSFLLGHGPNPKATTERESYRQIDKLIAEVRAWREAHAVDAPEPAIAQAELALVEPEAQPEPALQIRGGAVYADSRNIAAVFGKRHDNVLMAIDRLECSPEFTALNFKASTYADSTGRNVRRVEMTKDGCVFLITGFTGREAARFKEAYIAPQISPEPILEQPVMSEAAQEPANPSFDLALHIIEDEPRVLDTDLASALGLKREYDIRSTIKANAEELASFGPLPVTTGQSRGQMFTAYHLNEEQALLIVLLSRTDRAKQVRAEVIRIFTAWRRGALVQAQPELSGEMRQVIGGITKSVVRAAFADLVVQLLPDMVSAHLAKQNVLVRHGKTAGQIWDRHGLPKLKSAAVWLGNRLSELGCQIEGRGERGAIAVRLFDPDKAEIAFRNGLLLRARQYVAERQGQGRLRLLAPGSVL